MAQKRMLLYIQDPSLLQRLQEMVKAGDGGEVQVCACSDMDQVWQQSEGEGEWSGAMLYHERPERLLALKTGVLAHVDSGCIAVFTAMGIQECSWFLSPSSSLSSVSPSSPSLSSSLGDGLCLPPWRHMMALREDEGQLLPDPLEVQAFLQQMLVPQRGPFFHSPIQHYLEVPPLFWHRHWIRGSWDKARLLDCVQESLKSLKIGSLLKQRQLNIVEELCSNALYDASCHQAGVDHYGMVHKKKQLSPKPQHWPYCEWASDGKVLAVGMHDPWGELSEEQVWAHAAKVLDVAAVGNSPQYTAQGGAGIGLYKLAYLSRMLSFFVQKNHFTYVLACMCCDGHQWVAWNKPRTIHYFHVS